MNQNFLSSIDLASVFNPQKILTMIFALGLTQVLGSFLGRRLSATSGARLTGFLGGLLSSTATTASAAKVAKEKGTEQSSNQAMLTILASISAMLVEGWVLLLSGARDWHPTLWWVFAAPLLATWFLIRRDSREMVADGTTVSRQEFRWIPLLKLTIFILGILALSKVLQAAWGSGGLAGFTFLVSLFEIHGSVISNIQLHDSSGTMANSLLGYLLMISILASMVSKLFLIWTLGSQSLRKMAFVRISILMGSALAGGLVVWLSQRP